MLASAIFCNLGVRSAGGLTPLVSAILVKIFEASLVLALEISQRGDSGSRVQEKRRKTRGATETILINLQEAINQPERENGITVALCRCGEESKMVLTDKREGDLTKGPGKAGEADDITPEILPLDRC